MSRSIVSRTSAVADGCGATSSVAVPESRFAAKSTVRSSPMCVVTTTDGCANECGSATAAAADRAGAGVGVELVFVFIAQAARSAAQRRAAAVRRLAIIASGWMQDALQSPADERPAGNFGR
jgi:microcompartment protein CcmK/EutM